jgi:hypothetical protein
LQLVLKHVYNSTNKLHNFKNYFSINTNCLKMFKVLYFLLKNDHNFKSCKNMLITLNFIFLYHKLQLCSYVIHIMIHFTWQMTFEIWTFRNYILNFKKKIRHHNFLIMNVFQMWMVGYHHFNFFSIKIYLLKKSLA